MNFPKASSISFSANFLPMQVFFRVVVMYDSFSYCIVSFAFCSQRSVYAKAVYPELRKRPKTKGERYKSAERLVKLSDSDLHCHICLEFSCT